MSSLLFYNKNIYKSSSNKNQSYLFFFLQKVESLIKAILINQSILLKSDNTQLPVKRIPSVHKMISIGQWYFDKHKYYSDVIKFYKKDSTKNSIRSLTNVISLFQTLLNERIRSFSLGLQPKKKQHFFSQC